MQEIFGYSNSIIQNVSQVFKRYLFDEINWNARLIEIIGSRGVGKTTILLQKAQILNSQNRNQAVYLSLDDKLLYTNSIVDIAEDLVKYGVKYLFLDEVHKYPPKYKGLDWSAEIKNIYDRYPALKIIYSGSSVLKIYKGQGDLSRRKSSYRLAGLSFREYLELNKIVRVNRLTLENLLHDHQDITENIAYKLKIIPHFKDYLEKGYFPFYNEDPFSYYNRLNSIINVILETDIPAVSDISFETSNKLKKLLAAIATSAPYVPNLLKLRKNLFISDHRTLLKYLSFLDMAEVINTISQKAKGNKILHKPGKVYLGNTNYYYGLKNSGEATGAIRETFFASQLQVYHNLRLPRMGDFVVDELYTFEIGGKNKKGSQIRDVQNAFFALDDIEQGFNNQIPLWLFGFLY